VEIKFDSFLISFIGDLVEHYIIPQILFTILNGITSCNRNPFYLEIQHPQFFEQEIFEHPLEEMVL